MLAKGLTFTGDIAAPKITASTGILFGTDTAAANTLDDYEEGTWTPRFKDTVNGVDVTASYNKQVGYYIKTGRHIYLRWDIVTTALTAGDRHGIVGLPFLISDGDAYGGYGSIMNRSRSSFIEAERGDIDSGYIQSQVIF